MAIREYRCFYYVRARNKRFPANMFEEFSDSSPWPAFSAPAPLLLSYHQKLSAIIQENHSFDTYAIFFDKLHFLPPDMHTYVYASTG